MQLLDLKDVMTLTGLSRRTLFRYRLLENFGEVTVSGFPKFRADAVEAWCEAHGIKVHIGRAA